MGKPLEARYHESTASFGCKILLAPQNPARLQERKVRFISEARTLGVVRGSLLPFLRGCACMCAVSSVTSDSLRPMDCSFPGSSVHGNLQARIMEWAAMPSSRGSSCPRDQTASLLPSALAGGFFTARNIYSLPPPALDAAPQPCSVAGLTLPPQ